MKHTKNLTKRHIYSKIQNTSAIFLNHSRVIVHTIAKRFKKMHSGIFNVSSLLLLVSPKFFGTTASARRRVSMKSVQKTGSLGGRFAATLSVLATALIITACGGGGGGSATDLVVTLPPIVVTPPVVVVPSSIALTLASVGINGKGDVPKDATTAVVINITPSSFATSAASDFTVTGPATVTCNGIKQQSFSGAWVVAATAPNASSYVATGSVSFTGAPNATTCTIAMSVIATRGSVSSNTLPVTATFTTVADTNLSYKEKTYALWTVAYPYVVTKTGVTKVVNKTKYTFGVYPLGNCIIMDPSFTTKMKGQVLTECQAADGSGRHMFYIDPTRNELYEYADIVPSGIIFHSVTPLDLIRNKAGWDSQTKVTDGWYYTIGTGNWVLWFQSDSTSASTIVKEGTFVGDGNINYLATYSN